MIDQDAMSLSGRASPFFVYDPNEKQFMYFRSMDERDKWARCVIYNYVGEQWKEKVENVVAGVVTHCAQQENYRERPDDLDRFGVDRKGDYWAPDWSFKCNYELQPLSGDKSPSPSELLAQAAELIVLAGEPVNSLSDRWAGAGEVAADLTKIAKELQDLKGVLKLAEAVERHRDSNAVLRDAEPSSTQQS